jgi:hypothetical protein
MFSGHLYGQKVHPRVYRASAVNTIPISNLNLDLLLDGVTISALRPIDITWSSVIIRLRRTAASAPHCLTRQEFNAAINPNSVFLRIRPTAA